MPLKSLGVEEERIVWQCFVAVNYVPVVLIRMTEKVESQYRK